MKGGREEGKKGVGKEGRRRRKEGREGRKRRKEDWFRYQGINSYMTHIRSTIVS